MRMKTYRFRAQALTPIHIGSGSEIDPTAFVLEGNELVHIHPAQIISGLPESERQRFMEFLDRADLREIQNFLSHHARSSQESGSRLEVCESFKVQFQARASSPDRQFRVDMMPRNPHTGQAYLPGSALKGAIRTAVVNHFANRVPAFKSAIHTAVLAETNTKRKAQVLEEKALNRFHRDTHKDVFRLIHLEDVPLPDNSTRIDRAVNINPMGGESENIQMWVERIKARADTYESPEFAVTMRIDDTAMKHPRVMSSLGRKLDFETIVEACNHFYWGRMLAEADRFDERPTDGSSWKTLMKVFPLGREESGDIATIDPSKPYWSGPEFVTRRMLLRIGHFSHFESLSVDELRQGWDLKHRHPITGMGATRTRCLMENGKTPMPFGWLMLAWD